MKKKFKKVVKWKDKPEIFNILGGIVITTMSSISLCETFKYFGFVVFFTNCFSIIIGLGIIYFSLGSGRNVYWEEIK